MYIYEQYACIYKDISFIPTCLDINISYLQWPSRVTHRWLHLRMFASNLLQPRERSVVAAVRQLAIDTLEGMPGRKTVDICNQNMVSLS